MKMLLISLVIAISLVMSGCVAPDGEWKFDGTVKHTDEESATPVTTRPTEQATAEPYIDSCRGVDCEPECYNFDLHRTYCIDGVCVRGALLEEDSPRCGYIPPDPCEDVVCPDKCYGADLYDEYCLDGDCLAGDMIEANCPDCPGYVPPDPCDGVYCEPTCVGADKYSQKCVDGDCVPNTLIEENCPYCPGYVDPCDNVDMPISIVLDNGWTMEMYADRSGFVNTQLGEDEFGDPCVFDIQWICRECRSDRCVFMIGEESEYDTPIDIIYSGTVIIRMPSGAVKGHWF